MYFFYETFEDISIDIPNGIKTNAIWAGNGIDIDPYGNKRDNNDPVRNSLKVIDGVGYNKSKGVQVTKTIPMQGWNYTYYNYLPKPNGGSIFSDFQSPTWAKLETGRPAIVRFKAKGSGTADISVSSGWSGNAYYDSRFTWAESLTAEEFENRLINSQPIKINNPKKIEIVNYHLTTAFEDKYSYNFLLSLGCIEEQNGQWVFQPRKWEGAWRDRVRPNQTVTPSNERNVESITIGKQLTLLHNNSSGGGHINVSTNEWSDYSFNINIPHSKEILDTGSYFKYSNKFASAETLNVDDVKIAYAPKSKVYRDGNLVMDASYTVEFVDIKATDKAKPNSPSVSMNYNNGKITLNWDSVEDNGTDYTYQVSNVNEFNQESIKSKSFVVTAKSGIKHYEIYINGVLVDTTNNNSYTLKDNISKSTTLKVVAVDNVGLKSDSKNLDIPILTSKVMSKDNYIRLDWTMNDKNNKIFKIYQKKEGSDEFQTIGATNFEDTKQVKVLNVHPNTGGSETFTTWKDETLTLPPSARLKKWMEEPNKEHPKGYGKGLIEVTPVTIENFNANPDSYLKDSDGSYKYDVIMFGSWDAYLDKDLNTYSLSAVKSFIDTGRGVLVGHDVIRIHVMPMFNELRTYMNIEIPGDKNIDNAYSHAKYWLLSRDILKKREGLLTNYPWVIDKSQLTVPLTHSSVQWAYGDIWFEFTNIDTTTVPHFEGIIYNGLDGRGTNNHYLTTWNNTAMIQTGHSNGQATSDEQKILANTLFYLNQLSTDNFLNDYSGQDVKAPDKPVIYEHNFTDDGFIDLKFNEVKDNGNKYSYYVQSEDKQKNISVSNVVNETIISGIKGYSFIVDEKPDTVPDNVIEQSDNKPIRIKTNSSKELYVHIKAIDNAGNSSETYHYRVTDMTKPTMNLTLRPNTWTNGFVTIDISATDNESGIKYIILPNGSIIKGNTGSYNVTDNGKYYFKAVDYMGNETISSIIVSNIDKKKPNVTINNNQNWTNQDVQVTITSTDD